ncbi:hypothetical protein [Glycomyces algeriensis]|uniref:PIN domain-containing protein n=1 Tax=Glycomyces algeriensis TaxID=256037 RepID=A0A9W6G7P4_9ACTN|nr:hypothetical protein [Glycomyces algeriensis]MDA1366139.1 hypothetical protein [Glycomyces algeriensis]MDR7349093.1 hypothetical protein [Glycomyces algeriensis]GLI41793.1 hypothetical protein GALLR39Z86_16430 [Glycomyces algeriensis]
MPLRAIYDANILYPNTLRDILIRVAQEGLAQARWTEKILDEMQGALTRNRPDIAPRKLLRLRELMVGSVRDCLVNGYEPLIDALEHSGLIEAAAALRLS